MRKEFIKSMNYKLVEINLTDFYEQKGLMNQRNYILEKIYQDCNK